MHKTQRGASRPPGGPGTWAPWHGARQSSVKQAHRARRTQIIILYQQLPPPLCQLQAHSFVVVVLPSPSCPTGNRSTMAWSAAVRSALAASTPGYAWRVWGMGHGACLLLRLLSSRAVSCSLGLGFCRSVCFEICFFQFEKAAGEMAKLMKKPE